MRIFISVIFLVVANFNTLKAQIQKLEVAAGGGAMFYSGDLTDQFLPKSKQLNLHMMLSGTYRFTPAFFGRLNIVIGSVNGADSLTSKADSRNYHFKSPIYDINLMLGLDLQQVTKRLFNNDGKQKRFDHVKIFHGPKILIGAGYFYFNPMAEHDGKWYKLQPLGTEGQNLEGDYPEPYKRFQPSVKIGGEIGFGLTKKLRLDVYGIYNMLFTDYLDDISTKFPDSNELLASENGSLTSEFTYRLIDERIPNKGEIRGNPEHNDSFVNFGIKLTYSISKTQLDQIRHK